MPSFLARPRPRLDTLLSAVLLVAGSLVFIGAGRHHPIVGTALGPIGSEEYYRAFAAEIVRMPDWEPMHAMILAGPVLWALGAAGIARILPDAAAGLGEIGRAGLLLGATSWAVAFVLDGFIAPTFARTITGGSDPAEVGTALAAFKANQRTVARLGMVSVVLMSAAAVTFGLALLVSARRAGWRAIVGAAGIVVGAWPLIAAARGEFVPGPFTSPYWTITALALGGWFAALATALPLRPATGPAAVHGERWAVGAWSS
jgi:hypothetical protein